MDDDKSLSLSTKSGLWLVDKWGEAFVQWVGNSVAAAGGILILDFLRSQGSTHPAWLYFLLPALTLTAIAGLGIGVGALVKRRKTPKTDGGFEALAQDLLSGLTLTPEEAAASVIVDFNGVALFLDQNCPKAVLIWEFINTLPMSYDARLKSVACEIFPSWDADSRIDFIKTSELLVHFDGKSDRNDDFKNKRQDSVMLSLETAGRLRDALKSREAFRLELDVSVDVRVSGGDWWPVYTRHIKPLERSPYNRRSIQ